MKAIRITLLVTLLMGTAGASPIPVGGPPLDEDACGGDGTDSWCMFRPSWYCFGQHPLRPNACDMYDWECVSGGF